MVETDQATPSLLATPAEKPRRRLTKQAILAKNDQQFQEVPVPEWSEEGEEAYVVVRGLTGREREVWEASVVDSDGSNNKIKFENLRAKLIAATVVDESGTLLFSEQDIPILSLKSAAALQRVFVVAQQLSGLSRNDVEMLAKNSGRARTGGRSSA